MTNGTLYRSRRHVKKCDPVHCTEAGIEGLKRICLDGTQSKVAIGNYWYSSFPIDKRLIQGDALPPLVFDFVLEYTTRINKLQETKLGLEMNYTH